MKPLYRKDRSTAFFFRKKLAEEAKALLAEKTSRSGVKKSLVVLSVALIASGVLSLCLHLFFPGLGPLPFLVFILSAFVLPVVFLSAVVLCRELRYRRRFSEEIRRTSWAREIKFRGDLPWSLSDHPFSYESDEVNRFRFAFFGLVADYIADYTDQNMNLRSAISELVVSRSHRSWLDLERSPRFDHDTTWGVSPYLMDSRIRRTSQFLLYSTTYEKTGETIRSISTFDCDQELSGLMSLAETVDRSEHYNLEDFLSFALAPIEQIGTRGSSVRREHLWTVGMDELTGMRVSYWNAMVAKICETQHQGFALDTEMVIEMAKNTIEDICAEEVGETVAQ